MEEQAGAPYLVSLLILSTNLLCIPIARPLSTATQVTSYDDLVGKIDQWRNISSSGWMTWASTERTRISRRRVSGITWNYLVPM
ncbi:hypothetical protein C8J57DRAFT_1398751 [Mycena rebaudengoi]|nr:hypothetical protein C8J57DRAFT_1398751 [Mycena rebaudengoi]